MCCILCEEPVRSLTIGLAAVGVVAIVRTVQKSLTGSRKSESADVQAHTAEAVAPVVTDNAL